MKFSSIKSKEEFKAFCTPQEKDQEYVDGVFMSPRHEIGEEKSEIIVKIPTEKMDILLRLVGPTYDQISEDTRFISDLGAFHVAEFMSFDHRTKTLHVPCIHLDQNTTEGVLFPCYSDRSNADLMEPWGRLRNFFKKFHRATKEFEEKELEHYKRLREIVSFQPTLSRSNHRGNS